MRKSIVLNVVKSNILITSKGPLLFKNNFLLSSETVIGNLM